MAQLPVTKNKLLWYTFSMDNKDYSPKQKYDVQIDTINAINQQQRGRTFATLPYKLPGLIAILPTYITDRLVHHNLSHNAGLVVVLAVFLGFQLLIGLCLRSFLQRHPDLKWQILIR